MRSTIYVACLQVIERDPLNYKAYRWTRLVATMEEIRNPFKF